MNRKLNVAVLSLIIIGVFAVGFIAPQAKATTIESLQAQIQSLLKQVSQLQKQISQSSASPTALCRRAFNINLKIGDTGEEISALQQVLNEAGFYKEIVSGVFDENTTSAVVGFQEKYKDEVLSSFGLSRGTGFVGKATRAKLNSLFGCVIPPGQQVYIKNISPASGLVDSQATLNGFGFTSNDKIYFGGDKYSPIKPLTIITVTDSPEKLIFVVPKQLQRPMPTCPTGAYCAQVMPVPIKVTPGTYEIFVKNNKGTSNSVWFTVVEASTATSTPVLAPVISGVSGPTILKLGETGKWTVSASDPGQGVLTYSVLWGDEPTWSRATQAPQSSTYTQTATFTHSYSRAGNYNPTFTVTNSSGLSAKTSVSVRIGNEEVKTGDMKITVVDEYQEVHCIMAPCPPIRIIIDTAKVSIYNLSGVFMGADDTSDGTAAFYYLPAGSYIAYASASGYQNNKAGFKIIAGSGSYLTIELVK